MDLLTKYSLQDIIIFMVILALAFKGVFTFLSWLGNLLKDMVHRAETPQKLEKIIQNQKTEINDLKTCLKELDDAIHLLIKSDKDAIKAYITRQHHYFVYQKKWIDDYSLDCIERRYLHYKQEGGNTFISDLMQELRDLPKQPFVTSREESDLWQNE